MTHTYDDYLYALATADAAAAIAVLNAALAVPDQSAEQLIRDVLVRAQRQVGQLWMHGRWNVADEHAATAVTEQALTVICPPKAADAAAHRVVLACAEGEWHTMPARLGGELARASNVDIVQLGGSIPADHLSRHLNAKAPAALALSVTMPTNLIGATRSIQAARSQGIRVVVGGAAWGEGQHRARRLGADVHLHEPRDLSLFLDDVAHSAPTEEPPAIPPEALLLDSPAPEILTAALDRQCSANAWMRSMSPYQRDQSLQDLGWIARYAAASVACDDPTIVRDLISWLLAMLVPRGVPETAIIDSCSYLADAVSHEAPTAADVLQQEAVRAHEGRRAGSALSDPLSDPLGG
jgi:methanogenic corrinoid protein MtbC1